MYQSTDDSVTDIPMYTAGIIPKILSVGSCINGINCVDSLSSGDGSKEEDSNVSSLRR